MFVTLVAHGGEVTPEYEIPRVTLGTETPANWGSLSLVHYKLIQSSSEYFIDVVASQILCGSIARCA